MQHLTPRLRSAALPSLWAAMLFAGTIAVLGAATWFAYHRSYSVAVGLFVAPGLILLSIALLQRVLRQEPYPVMRSIVLWGLLLKMLGAFGRYGMAYLMYGGSDATLYDRWGRVIAGLLRQGIFDVETGASGSAGTEFIRLVTGVIYTFIGPSQIGGFLVFSWLGFWGLFFFYRAYRVTFPDANPILFGCLLFFVPSMFFWPSGIGKEAWIMFTLGLATLGCAKLFRSRLSGFWQAAVGTLGVAAVRPHIAVLLVVSMVVGYTLGRVESGAGKGINPILKGLVITVLLIGALMVANNAAQYFGVEDASLDSATEVASQANRRTTQGGSEFNAPNPQSLGGFPLAALTVLYRPFVFEAHNLQGLLTALETAFFLGLTIVCLPRLVRNARQFRRSGFLLASLVYVALFTYFFGAIGNFGIIARQRVQVLPFLFFILAAPESIHTRRSELGVRAQGEAGLLADPELRAGQAGRHHEVNRRLDSAWGEVLRPSSGASSGGEPCVH